MTRLIAGKFGGRTLMSPRGNKTRPTSDLVREAVFATIAVWAGKGADLDTALEGLSFLDLFAGTGAMGFEAASRGAEQVVFVEADLPTQELITRNGFALGCPAVVRNETAERHCGKPARSPFDVIWLDPPYDHETSAVNALLNDIAEHGWLRSSGLVAVERSTRSDPPTFPGAFPEWQSRRYGETTVYFGKGDGQ